MLIAGLLAALLGNILIGAGQTLQKYALNRLSRDRVVKPPLLPTGRRGRRIETHAKYGSGGRPRYTDSAWIAGIVLNYIGEICGNWLALSLASAAVVTPMGIMSVVVNAVLAQRFLGEVVGREKRRGYYAIMLGVLLIILSAPPSDSSPSTLLRTISILSTGAFSTFVALSMAFLTVLIYSAYVRGNDSVELLVLIVSLFGAISVVSSKSLGTMARLGVANLDIPNGAPAGLAVNGTLPKQPSQAFPAPALSESISSTVIFLVLSLLGQEFFKQQLLSRFPLTRFQPIHYATFNSLSVLSSIFLFGELQGASAAAVVRFFSGFIIGMAIVVYGSLMIGKGEPETPADGAPLSSLVQGMFDVGEKEQAD